MPIIVLFVLFLSGCASSVAPVSTAPSPSHFWYVVETTAPPEKIWNVWTDVSNWRAWDTGLKNAEMTGAFAKNAKGTITSLDDRQSEFRVVEFESGKSYTYEVGLFLSSLFVKRSFEVVNGKTVFKHEVWFSGMTAGMFAGMLGKDFQKMLPEVMENVKTLAEKP
jgi:hypothetical protein